MAKIKTSIAIDEELWQNFKREALLRGGLRKGSVSAALEEAMTTWMRVKTITNPIQISEKLYPLIDNLKLDVKIDLTDLYSVSSGPSCMAAEILLSILSKYNLAPVAVVNDSPDGGVRATVDEDKLEKIIKSGKYTVISLFDGYERAYAFVEPPE